MVEKGRFIWDRKIFVWGSEKMYYVAICDEHEEFIQYMKALVEWCMPEEKMEFLEYRSGEELIADIKEKDCDLLRFFLNFG